MSVIVSYICSLLHILKIFTTKFLIFIIAYNCIGLLNIVFNILLKRPEHTERVDIELEPNEKMHRNYVDICSS